MDDATQTKPYEIVHEERPGYLYVSVTAPDISYHIAREYWRETLRRVNAAGSTRLMFHKQIAATLSMADIYTVGAELAGELVSVKLAVVDKHTAPEIIDFRELVLTNRGVSTKTFSDEDTAEAWLLAG